MLVKIVSSKRKKKRREHKSGLSLSPSLRDKMCGSLNGVLCALHLMSSLFFFRSFSFLCPSSIYGSAFTLTGAVKVSCTWSSPSVKMASTCWDRTARPLTPSQSSSTFTPHTNSRSEAPSTCPCYSQCWCRHSDRPGAPFQWSDTLNMNVWLDLPSGVKAFSSILTGRLLMIQHMRSLYSYLPLLCTRAKLKHLGDWFTWNAVPELEAPFLSHPNEADLRTKKRSFHCISFQWMFAELRRGESVYSECTEDQQETEIKLLLFHINTSSTLVKYCCC